MPKKNSIPTISIIMPVYNGEKWLHDSIPSVLNQTFSDWELILVDDGSTDNSAAILNQYAKQDSRIHVFHNQNAGPGKSLNFGIGKATGEYLCFIDQDDKYINSYLQTMFDAINGTNADMALCYGRFFNPETNYSARIGYPYFESGVLPNENKIKVLNYFFPQWTKIVRRNFIKQYDITFPGKHNKVHDVPFHVLCLWFANKVIIVNQELYMHRQHANQITHNLADFYKEGNIKSVLDIEKYYKTHKQKDKSLMLFAMKLINFKGNFRQNLTIKRLKLCYQFKETIKKIFYSKHIGERHIRKRILFIKFKKRIHGTRLHVPNILNCGRCSYFALNLTIANPDQTVIGNFCSIGANVRLGHGEHPKDFLSTSPYFYLDSLRWKSNKTKSYNDKFSYLAPIIIGNDVWIGDNVFVKNGIKIGNGAIIGACSVVTHDVPPYAVVAGVPAKVIKYRFDEKTIKKLLKLPWWNLPDEVIKQIPFDDIKSAICFIEKHMEYR